MTANFNDAAVFSVFDKLTSYALATGRFDQVNQHEPKNAPGHGITCSIWMQSIRPWHSGQATTTGNVIFNARLYTNFRGQPFDYIDPNLTAATCDYMGALAGDFALGGDNSVYAIDLLGMTGTSLSMQAGYVEIDRQMMRVMTVTIPIIINDMFVQAA